MFLHRRWQALASRHATAVCLLFLGLLLTPTRAAADEDERVRLEEELSNELGLQSPSDVQPSRSPAPSGPAGQLLPDISLIGSFLGAWFSDEPSLRAPAHEPLHRGFQLQELELALQSNIDPFVRADVFLALTLEGIEVEEAYATTLGLPLNLQLRVGQMYAPFGRFNQLHYLEATPFADLPLPNRRFFGGEQLRGLGAEGSWLAPLPFFLELRASLLTAENELSFGVPGEDVEDFGDLLAVVRALTSIDLMDRLTLNLGSSFATGPNTNQTPLEHRRYRTTIWGADLYLKLRDRSSRAYTALQAEYLYRRAAAPGGSFEQGGAYAWLVRRFNPRWEGAIRADLLGSPAAEPTLSQDIDGSNPFFEPARQRRVGASISFYPSEFQRIRLQSNLDIIARTNAPSRLIQEYFIQYQIVMGAHGAHLF